MLTHADILEKRAQRKEKAIKSLQIKKSLSPNQNSKNSNIIKYENTIDSNVDNLYFDSIKAKLAILEKSVELSYN